MPRLKMHVHKFKFVQKNFFLGLEDFLHDSHPLTCTHTSHVVRIMLKFFVQHGGYGLCTDNASIIHTTWALLVFG